MGRPEGTNYLEDLGLDGSIILKWILKKEDGNVGCTGLAKYRYKWRALVNTVMDFQVS
jgi:hypothetical protein